MHPTRTITGIVLLAGLFSVICATPALAATPPVAHPNSATVLADSSRVLAKLLFTDPDATDTRYFILERAPAHGTLEYIFGGYTPVPAGNPGVYTPYWNYTPHAGYVGPDSFTWKVFDGTFTSNTATFSITVAANTVPQAKYANVAVVKDTATTIHASFVDPDAQTFTVTVVSPPAHGTVTVSGKRFNYTPSPGYVGPDVFTWKVSDGPSTSVVATCALLVREVNNRAGMLVSIVVNDALLPQIQTEVNRLKTDLLAEGYSAKIQPLPGTTSPTNLWTYLQSEYRTPGQFMAGAILIGGLAFARNTSSYELSDCSYWNMDILGDVSKQHIWVSRIWAQGNGGFSFGDEATLIKRALQANHDYRTGASRLPHTAYQYDSIFNVNSTAKFLPVWPAAEYLAPELAFVKGGELIHEMSHGGPGAYSDKSVMHSCGIHDRLAQVRFALCTSCVSGSPGGVVNNQLLTRGGGNVLSIGATEVEYVGAFNIANNTGLLGRLAAGDSWGNGLVTYPFSGVYRAICYGDLSLGVKESPSNQMPVVNTLTASVTSGIAPLTVNLSATAGDPDGSLANWEWFPAGHYYGKATPTVSGPAVTSASFTYTLPHRYLARIEVTDNYKARAWKEVEIRVAPSPGQPLRINCGRALVDYANGCYAPDLEYTDSTGRLWIHDQVYAAGTWGTNGINMNVAPFSGDVLGTTDDPLYLYYTGDYYGTGVTYTVPLANGGYTVRFGYCDMRNTAAGRRLADISIEGAPVHTAFDIVGTFGAKTPGTTSHHVTLTDGVMQIFIKTNPGGSATGNDKMAIINTLEIIPDGGVNSSPVAANQSRATSEDTALALVLTASDPENNPLTYAIVTPPAHGTLAGAAPNLIYTPAANYNGSDSFTFRAHDGMVNGNVATVSLAVSAVNDPPVISASSPAGAGLSLMTGTSVTLDVTAGDVDGDTLAYAWTRAGVAAGSNQRSYIFTGTAADVGAVRTVAVNVSDGKGGSVPRSWAITVLAANQAPVIASEPWASPNPAVLSSGTVLQVVATDTDQGPAALTYTWSKLSGPGTVAFSPNGSTLSDQSTAAFGVAGSYVVRVTVSDGEASAFADLPITVQSAGSPETVVLQDGLNGYTGTRDSFLFGYPSHENTNKGNLPYIYLAPAMTPVVRFAIFQAQGGPVPNGVQIQSAKLSLYKYSVYNYTVQVRRLLKDWKELEVSWNKANATTPWTVPGATGSGSDLLAIPDAQTNILWAAGWVEIDVTAGVKAFATGSSNFGWELVGLTGNNNIKTFYSREYAVNPSLRPKLTISYAP